jgi:hypothetical protein
LGRSAPFLLSSRKSKLSAFPPSKSNEDWLK